MKIRENKQIMQISYTYVEKHKGVSQTEENRREVKEIDRKIKDR